MSKVSERTEAGKESRERLSIHRASIELAYTEASQAYKATPDPHQ